MSTIYHSNILIYCVQVLLDLRFSGFDLQPETISRLCQKVQAVNACLRVTVNPFARTAKKLSKPQLLLLATPVVLTGSRWDFVNYDLRAQERNAGTGLNGGKLSCYSLFSSVDKDRGAQLSSMLINLTLYWK